LLANSSEPLTLAEVARQLGCSKSLVYRVVGELETRHLVRRTPERTVTLGVAALEVGNAYAARASYADSTRQILRELAHLIGETVHLGVLRGTEVLYLMNQQAPNSVVTISYAGNRLPAHCTALGKALLARLDDDEVERLFGGHYRQLTPRSVTSFEALRNELDRVRVQGHATLEMEAVMGRCAVAVCVDVPGLGETAALAVSGFAEGFFERLTEFVGALTWARERLARECSARSALDDHHDGESRVWETVHVGDIGRSGDGGPGARQASPSA
jgi:DNA-binding IclR family transcriptional regulator